MSVNDQLYGCRFLSRVRWLATVCLVAIVPAQLQAQPDGRFTSQWSLANSAVSLDRSSPRQLIQMVINTSREITAEQSFKRVRIQNPNILNAIPLEGGNRLQISAVATGITQIDLLGADESVHTIEVMVLGDVRELEAVLQHNFPDGQISVMPVQQGCIVRGFVNDPDHVEQVIAIAELYFPTVINKIDVSGVHTVQLEVQIMEVSRTKLRELGIDWALQTSGGTTIVQGVSGIVGASGALNPGPETTFRFSVVDDGTTFLSALNALHRNNLVKVLATPTLTAVDGRPASFNSGGEIPIIVPAGLGQVAVQFREFGTRLDYVAKVRGNGKIWLEVRPYVSEIDPTRSILLDGINVPGLRSRFLETGVELGAGQTLALGGLLQVRTEATSSGIPVLGDMPYIGTFFRSTREQQNEVELLITVTPNFAGPMDPHEVPRSAPGTSSQSPTNKDLYLRGHIETPLTGDPNCVQPGLVETAGFAPQAPAGYHSQPSQPQQPTPNPAAMSIGPNAPKLAQPPAYYPSSEGLEPLVR
jgi:pilus assembly protein CpaC